MDRPFKRLVVEHRYNGDKMAILVAWALNPAFNEAGPYHFLLQRGRAVNDDHWEDIAETVDQAWLFDNRPIFAQHDNSTFYRVVLTDGEGAKYTSQPASADQSWSHYDWRLAREILRKETLVQRKRGGTKGYLIKRRIWGDPCPTCLDPNTGAVTDSHCPVCFGTGVVQGYYPSVEYWVIMNPTQRLKKIGGDEGLTTAIVETVRGLAWPCPEANDIWVQAGKNKRFRVEGDIVAAARHRGIDLILNLRLNELPLENIVYDIPV